MTSIEIGSKNIQKKVRSQDMSVASVAVTRILKLINFAHWRQNEG